eukprot:scaffold4811_cov69-Phaeocystis_antarctica.AAC.2
MDEAEASDAAPGAVAKQQIVVNEGDRRKMTTTEADVGISELLGDGPSFHARIKQCAEDFEVIELTSAGTVPGVADGNPSIPLRGAEADLNVEAHPTAAPSAAPASAALPPPPDAVQVGWPLDAAVNLLDPNGIPPSPIEPLVTALGQEGAGALWGWLLANPGLSLLQAPAPHMLPSPPEKEARTRLHLAVLSLCPALCTRCVVSKWRVVSNASTVVVSSQSSAVSRQPSAVSRQSSVVSRQSSVGGRRIDRREWPAPDRAAPPAARRGGRARAAALFGAEAERPRSSALRARCRARGAHATAPATALRAVAQAVGGADAGAQADELRPSSLPSCSLK